MVLRIRAERAEDLELRLADRITGFAGSMPFVYAHALVFAVWMLVFERSPWPTLTLAVSLEAIFLSCFVMIGQNRQAAFQQAKADHDFAEEEQELKLNTELTREIHELTSEIHGRLLSADGSSRPRSQRTPSSEQPSPAIRPDSSRGLAAASAGMRSGSSPIDAARYRHSAPSVNGPKASRRSTIG